MPRARRFTVDDLPYLPSWGLRSEVLDGRLVLAPPASRRHDRVVANLASRFALVLPSDVRPQQGVTVRLPDGDAAVPDLAVVSGAGRREPTVVPAGAVPTVVEVVSADGRNFDRVWKRDQYAAAGIGCYWRVELEPWPGYRGPLPVIVVRVRGSIGRREMIAAAGQLHALPVAHRYGSGGEAEIVLVRLDPAALPVRHAAAW